MHEDSIDTVYPKVYESLKNTTEEHFLNDKPTEEEPGKANVESMVTIPIHQASSSVPPLSTPIIDLTPPKPVSPLVQELKICANFEKKQKLQDKTTQALSSKVFTLENHDLYSKIDNYVNETVKEVPEYKALYDALEVSIHRKNREEFVEATAKSRKRRHDDQDPLPPPPKDSDQSKKKRHDSDASALKQA
ncbi:hypothetical protein Tco_0734294 [Tanacetum coccineum]